MSATAVLGRDAMPEWLHSEMPPGYQTRLQEIQRLSADLKEMERFGQLLWRAGDGLARSVADTFVSLGFEVIRPDDDHAPVIVLMPERRRLLIHVAASSDVVQKKSPELTHVFRHLNETAEASDRVVLLLNPSPGLRPAERPPAVGAEALELLQRLRANVLTGPSLFSMWQLSLDDKERARRLVDRLHEQDGGLFLAPAVR